MRIALSCLTVVLALAGCDRPITPGPSETRGLPVLQPVPPSGGAGGVVPLERPAGSRGGDKGS
ncbi:hypothetical protein E2C06_06045 [Dankookia rubra]|uniref:Uncharacterized protein n=1 Tax=Dankookia rubra TaxID=1442381 RepID=A0A4V3AAI3_9PROT|nr:hypothetical protein [Dankookia rubra]TDH63395.1 hypothetical protein E2C06_06045 [Dankookia rubra]